MAQPTEPLLQPNGKPQHDRRRRSLSSLTFCELISLSLRHDETKFSLAPTIRELLFIVLLVVTPGYLWVLLLHDGGFSLIGLVIGPPIVVSTVILLDFFRHRWLGPRQNVEGIVIAAMCMFGKQNTVSANLLARLAYWYECVRDFEEALQCYQRMMDFVPPKQRSKAYPEIRRCMAHLHELLGQNEEALQIHQDAVSEMRENLSTTKHNTSALYHALLRLGDGYRRVSQCDSALVSYREAQSLLQGTAWQNTMDATKSWERIASIHESQSQPKEALQCLNHALEIHLINEGEFPKSRHLAHLYHRMGDLVQGKGEDARSFWNLAKEVYGRSGKSNEDREMATLSRKIEDSQVASAC